jgi:hypothetical protein
LDATLFDESLDDVLDPVAGGGGRAYLQKNQPFHRLAYRSTHTNLL